MTLDGKTCRQALTEFREAEILRAARKVFAERGFAAATVDMIAAEAGVAKGTVYLYYSSKEEIFWTALNSRLREMLQRTREEVGKAEGTRAKIETGLRVRFEFLRSDEAFLRMYLLEFGRHCTMGPAHRQQKLETYREAADFIASILSEGVEAGDLRPIPPFETAIALMELTKAVFAMRVLGMTDPQADFNGERFVLDLFWNGIAKHPA